MSLESALMMAADPASHWFESWVGPSCRQRGCYASPQTSSRGSILPCLELSRLDIWQSARSSLRFAAVVVVSRCSIPQGLGGFEVPLRSLVGIPQCSTGPPSPESIDSLLQTVLTCLSSLRRYPGTYLLMSFKVSSDSCPRYF